MRYLFGFNCFDIESIATFILISSGCSNISWWLQTAHESYFFKELFKKQNWQKVCPQCKVMGLTYIFEQREHYNSFESNFFCLFYMYREFLQKQSPRPSSLWSIVPSTAASMELSLSDSADLLIYSNFIGGLSSKALPFSPLRFSYMFICFERNRFGKLLFLG